MTPSRGWTCSPDMTPLDLFSWSTMKAFVEHETPVDSILLSELLLLAIQLKYLIFNLSTGYTKGTKGVLKCTVITLKYFVDNVNK